MSLGVQRSSTIIERLSVAFAGVTILAVFLHEPVRQARGLHAEKELIRVLNEIDGAEQLYLSQAPTSPRTPHGADPPGLLTVKVAALRLVQSTSENIGSAETKHAQAIVALAFGQLEQALRAQKDAVQRAPSNAAMWNDLAAIHLQRARRLGEADEFAAALAAADHALRLDPSYAPALFNRAAIVEAMGVRTEAIRAWQVYLRVDVHSNQSNEALRRLNELNRPTTDARWRIMRDRLDRADESEINSITRAFPRQARLWAEVEIQSRWAKAHLDGGADEAARQLAIARTMGHALQGSTGEALLADSVGRIDGAAGGDARALARAQLTYQKARLMMARGLFSDALGPLREAADEFARLHSPMENHCRTYLANALAELHRTEESLDLLEKIRIPAGRSYHALSAQVLWEIGLCEGLRGRWSAALGALSQSLAGFRQLGERGFEGRVQTILGESYDILGQPAEGWKQRVEATRILGREGDLRSLHIALAGGTYAAMFAQHWEMARSLSLLETAIAVDATEPLLMARDNIRKAIIHLRLGNHAAASEAVRAGRAVAGTIAEPRSAVRTLADLDFADALITRMQDPPRAVRLLDRAIATYRGASLNIYLPDLYLERGRTLRQMGDARGAARDFDLAIQTLLTERETIPGTDLRTGIFDNASAVFDEAIDLALREGAIERTFAIVESSRARALLDEINKPSMIPFAVVSSAQLTASLEGDVFIEFVTMRDKTVVIVAGVDGLRSYQIPMGEAELARRVLDLDQLIVAEKPIQTIAEKSEELYRRLLSPAGLSPGTNLVISPDGALQGLPWAVLRNPATRRCLVEDHLFLVVPSAAVFVAASAQATSRGNTSPKDVLAIGNPDFDRQRFPQLPELSSGEAETRAIHKKYATGDLWLGVGATAVRFLRTAPEHEVIHFAGHSVVGTTPADDSFLLFAPDQAQSNGGELYSSDVTGLQFQRTRLVILAGCSTLRGPAVGREGTMSIARSFLAAGVPTVIGALWDLDDDASQELFVRLHESLVAGLSPEAALRCAQLSMIRASHAKLNHPAAWAGVEAVGGSLGH